MKINNFGRPEHRFVSNRVLAALKDLEKELGLTFVADGGLVGQQSGMIKLTIQVNDASATQAAKETFKHYARRYGINPDAFEKTFISKNTAYKVVGFAPSRPKYPVDCVRLGDNTPFKFPLDIIKRHFPVAVAAAS